MVLYSIPKEADWVALKKTTLPKEKWNIEIQDIDEAIKPFEDFQYDFIDVPKRMQDADKGYQFPMIDCHYWKHGFMEILHCWVMLLIQWFLSLPMEPPKQ